MTQFSEVSISRKKIRQLVRQRRKKINLEQQLIYSQQAAKRMMIWKPIIMAYNIALFLSFDGEIDTKFLINQFWNTGKKVYLPVLHPLRPGNLLFLHYHPKTKLIVNYLKIREPIMDMNNVLPISKLDIIIIPLVAFDKDGYRLGMGGGFYDRTLQNWQKYNFQLVGYAYDCQLVDNIPIEYWDIRLPTVITPSKLWTW